MTVERALISASGGTKKSYWLDTLTSSAPGDGNAVYVDASGNVYVYGWRNPSGYETIVAKYNSVGALQWQRSLDTNTSRRPGGIVVDSSGNVFVASTGNNGSGYFQFCLFKYNSSGTLQWQNTLSYGVTEQGNGIFADSKGNIYVAGDVTISNLALLLAKLPSDGTLTGTYGSFTYAAASLTSSTSTMTDAAGGMADNAGSMSAGTPTYTSSTSTLTSSTTVIL